MRLARLVTWGCALGVPATLFMDVGSSAVRAAGLTRGLPPAAMGRWFGYMGHGSFAHTDVLAATPLPGELGIALVAHYCIGSALAAGYLLVSRRAGSTSPRARAGLAVAYGTATSLISLFVMYPAMGYGLFGRAAPGELRLFSTSLINHVLFGIGLALSSFLLRRRIDSALAVHSPVASSALSGGRADPSS